MENDEDSPLLEPIAIRDETGHVILRVGLTFTLYFENGCDREVMGRVAECVTHCRAVASRQLRWIMLPDAERFQRITPDAIEAFCRWIREGVPRTAGSPIGRGAKRA